MLPRRIAPMLAKTASHHFDSDRHLFEIKWDGTRAIIFVENGEMRIQNRHFVEIQEHYPEFANFRALPDGIVLDGEIVVLRDGKPSFPLLQQKVSISNPLQIEILSRQIPATFIAFDLLFLNGESIMAKTLVERKKHLAEVTKGFSDPHFLVTDYILIYGERYFREIERFDLEGVMAKRLNSPYLPGRRSASWLKMKVSRTALFDVVGFIQLDDQPSISSLLLAEHTLHGLIYRGRVGSGFTESQRHNLYMLMAKAPSMANHPRGAKARIHWVEVKLKAKVRYMDLTKSGHLRAPVIVEIVEDV